LVINPLNAKLNHPVCHLLALLGAHHVSHVSGIRVKRKCHVHVPWISNSSQEVTPLEGISHIHPKDVNTHVG